MNEPLDGEQRLDITYVDILDAATELLAREEFAGKLYMQFERQMSEERPTKRAFGRVNSSVVFETAAMLDPLSSPCLLVFGSDAAHAMQNHSRQPVYSKYSPREFLKHTC